MGVCFAMGYNPTIGDSKVCITVTNTSPGIDTEYHEHIFEMFGRAVHRDNHLGSELGLIFCKIAIESRGRCIGVESEADKGSAFWFVLPQDRNDRDFHKAVAWNLTCISSCLARSIMEPSERDVQR